MLICQPVSFAGKTHVLAAAADRDSQFVLVDDDVHRMLFFIDDDRLDGRRRERADHELGGILRP